MPIIWKITIHRFDLVDNNPLRTQYRILLKPVHYSSTVLSFPFHLIFHFLLWNLFLLYLYWYLSFLICTFSFIFHRLTLFSLLFFFLWNPAVQPEEKKWNKPKGPKHNKTKTKVTKKLNHPDNSLNCFKMQSFITWIHNLCSIKFIHRIMSSAEEPGQHHFCLLKLMQLVFPMSISYSICGGSSKGWGKHSHVNQLSAPPYMKVKRFFQF